MDKKYSPPSGYIKSNLKTPQEFKGSHAGSRVLCISNGHSAKFVLDNKILCRSKFDIIIITNHALTHFDDIADYHLCTEKTSPTNKVPDILNSGNYRRDLPRIFNYKGIEKYSSKYNLYKVIRTPYEDGLNIRKYIQTNGKEGLFTGNVNKRNMATGSVTLQSMHLASILGAAEIYLIGADLIFRDKYDHYYPDNQYRDSSEQNKLKPNNRIHIVDVEHQGKKYQTTDYFRDSAVCIDNAISTMFKEIAVYDFSDGLLTNAQKVNINDFFGTDNE